MKGHSIEVSEQRIASQIPQVIRLPGLGTQQGMSDVVAANCSARRESTKPEQRVLVE